MASSSPREPIFSFSTRLNDDENRTLEDIIERSALDVYRALSRYIESKGSRLVIIPPNTPRRMRETEGGG
jgi:hypothetical protein